MNEYALVQSIWKLHEEGANTALPAACIHEVILCLSRLMAGARPVELQQMILELVKHGERANQRLGSPGGEDNPEPIPLGLSAEEETLLKMRLSRLCPLEEPPL